MKQLHYKLLNNITPIAVGLYAVYVICWHFHIINHLDFGDSVDVFSHKEANWSFLIERYFGWSSRLLIEVPLIWLSKYPSVFVVVNVITMGLFPYITWRLFRRFDLLKNQFWLVLLIFMLYPFQEMNSAGWIATLANYYYPLFYGTLSLFLIADEKYPINGWRYFMCIICLLFACNVEQLCIVFVLLFVFQTYHSRCYRYYAIPTLLTIASLLFIVLSPGNQGRSLFSIYAYLPDFVNYPLIYKIYLGFQSTMYRYFATINPPFLGLLCVLATYVYLKQGRVFKLLPLLIACILPFLHIEMRYVPTAFENRDSHYWHSYLIFSASIYLCLHILLVIYELFDNKKHAWVIIGILFLGFCARFVMGLSPTLFASDKRTFIFTDFAIIFATLLLISLFTHITRHKLKLDRKSL